MILVEEDKQLGGNPGVKWRSMVEGAFLGFWVIKCRMMQ